MRPDVAPALRMRRRATVVVLAPHLLTPLRNGADVYVWSKYAALDPSVWDARLIAADGIYTLDDGGHWELIRRIVPTHRGRFGALAVMLARGVDELSARCDTRAYLGLCNEVDVKTFDLVVCSYPSTIRIATAAGVDPDQLLIETHDFDPKVHLDRALERRGLRRVLAALAAARAHALLHSIPPSMPMVALGPADTMLYRALGFRNVVQGRLGFETRKPRVRFPSAEEPRLLFVGSLSMTVDEVALRSFAEGPLRQLRRHLGRPLWFGVAGSNPSRALSDFLAVEGIAVHANPSDAELSSLLESSHATVLPFTGHNGPKLKFAHSASHGVPILSFVEPPEGLEGTPGVLVSTDMAAWAEWLDRLSSRVALSRLWAGELQRAAARNAWAVIVAKELAELPLPGRPASTAIANAAVR